MIRLRPVFVLFSCLVAVGVGVNAYAGSTTPLPPNVFAVDNNPSKPTFGTPLAQDGTTWAKAFNNIQDGIDAAFAAGGGEVWVADGTYSEGRGEGWGNPSVTGSLVMKTDVELYGGFQGYDADDFIGNETARGQRTITQGVSIIDGSTSRGGAAAYHVVAIGGQSAATSGVVLDGFHITGGLASSGDASSYHLNRGAGIYIYGSPAAFNDWPIVRNCTIRGNTARVGGGGVALVFNPTTNTGGNAIIENSVIYNNIAERNPDADGNPIVGGGGIFVDAGDAISASTPYIRYCTFNSNSAQAIGSSPFGTGSDAIYAYANAPGCSPVVTHSIFWPNTATSIKSEGSVNYDGGCSITQSIVNPAYACPAYVNESDPSPASPFLLSSCGTGNITSNPNFTGTPPEFPLTPGSPAQNIGVLLVPGTDIQGLTRSAPDIGAYEGDGTLVGPTANIDAAALAPTTQYFPESYNLQNNNGSFGTMGSAGTRVVWDIDDDGDEDFNIINPVANYTAPPYAPGTITARLVMSNGLGSSEDTVTFTLANPVSVAAPTPANPTRNNYDTVTFTVGSGSSPAGGYPPYNYQWQFSTDGVTFGTTVRDGNPLADGSYTSTRPGRNPDFAAGVIPDAYEVDVPWSISGVNTATLTIDHALRGIHNGYYRCVVTDSQFTTLGIAEGRVNSASTQLTLNQKLIILDSPASLTLYEGNASSIPVTVFGGVDPQSQYTYGWDLFDPVSGETWSISNSNVDPYEFFADADPPVKASPTSWAADTGSPGFYSLLVSDISIGGLNGNARVENLPVDVEPAVDVEITTSGGDLIVNVTETLTLNTTIAGGYPGYTYVWTWNGTELEDGQPHPSGSSANISGATTATLVVANMTVSDAGDYAVQVVDSKGDAMNLADPCPSHNGLCSDTSQVTAQVTNNLIVQDDPDSFTVYAGDTVSFEVTAAGGDPGSYSFEWKFETEDGFGPFTIPVVGPHPASQTGSSVQVTQVDTDTSRLTVSNVGVEVVPTIRGDEGNYYCIVNDGVLINQPDTSDDGVLQVFRPLSITTQPQTQTVYEGANVTFSVQATGGINANRSFQWRVNTGSGFTDIVGETASTLTLNGVTMAQDGNLYQCVVTAPNSDVTTPLTNYQLASQSATLMVSEALVIVGDPDDVAAYTTDPAFELHSEFVGGLPFGTAPVYQTDWRRTGISPAGPEVSAGAGTLILGNPNTTELTVNPGAVGAGIYDYRVEITDQVDTTSSGSARVEIADMPTFGQGLVDSTVREGDDFTWTVVVNGGIQPLTYVWEHQIDDGNKALVWVTLPSTGPSHLIEDVAPEDAGEYRVTVDDSGDALPIQSQATLTIGDALPVAGGLGLAALAALSALGGAMSLRRRR